MSTPADRVHDDSAPAADTARPPIPPRPIVPRGLEHLLEPHQARANAEARAAAGAAALDVAPPMSEAPPATEEADRAPAGQPARRRNVRLSEADELVLQRLRAAYGSPSYTATIIRAIHAAANVEGVRTPGPPPAPPAPAATAKG